MKRFRQTMIVEFDVLANDEREASRLIDSYIFDQPDALDWNPSNTVIVPEEDDYFSPING